MVTRGPRAPGATLKDAPPVAVRPPPRRRASLTRPIRGARQSPFGSLLASILALQAARFISDIALAASTSPRNYGVWKLVQVALAFAPLILLGIPSGMNRRLPASRAGPDTRLAGTIVATGYGASLVGLGVAGGLVGAVMPGSSDVLVAAVLVTWGLWGISLSVLNGLELFRRLAMLQYCVAVLLIAFLPLTVWGGISGFLFSYAVIGAAGTASACCIAHRAVGSRLDPRILVRLVQSGLPLAFLALGYLSMTALDRIVVQLRMGLDAVGVYGLAATVFVAVSTIPMTAVQYWYPRTLRTFAASRDVAAAVAEARRQSRLLLLVTAAVGIVVATALVPAVKFALPEYEEAIPAAYAMLPGVLVLPAVGVYGNLLIALERTRPYLVTQLVCVSLELALLVGATESGSITLVAAAVSVTYCVYYFLLRKAAVGASRRMTGA